MWIAILIFLNCMEFHFFSQVNGLAPQSEMSQINPFLLFSHLSIKQVEELMKNAIVEEGIDETDLEKKSGGSFLDKNMDLRLQEKIDNPHLLKALISSVDELDYFLFETEPTEIFDEPMILSSRRGVRDAFLSEELKGVLIEYGEKEEYHSLISLPRLYGGVSSRLFDLNAYSSNYTTPLIESLGRIWASKTTSFSVDMGEWLSANLRWGADVNQSSSHGDPFYLAMHFFWTWREYNIKEVVDELKKYGGNLNDDTLALRTVSVEKAHLFHSLFTHATQSLDQFPHSALYHLIGINNYEEKRRKVEAKRINDMETLNAPGRHKVSFIIKYLLSKGSDPHKEVIHLGSMFYCFVEQMSRCEEINKETEEAYVAFLCEGVDFFVQTNEGATPLSLLYKDNKWRDEAGKQRIVRMTLDFFKSKPPAPYTNLIQDRRGRFVGRIEGLTEGLKKHPYEPDSLRDLTLDSSDEFYSDVWTYKAVEELKKSSCLKDFIFKWSRLFMNFDSPINELRTHYISVQIKEILSNRIDLFLNEDVNRFLEDYQRLKIPYEALILTCIYLLNQEGKAKQFALQCLINCKAKLSQLPFSPKERSYLELFDQTKENLSEEKIFQAIKQEKPWIYSIVLILNEEQSIEVKKRCIEESVKVAPYGLWNVMPRMVQLTLDRNIMTSFAGRQEEKHHRKQEELLDIYRQMKQEAKETQEVKNIKELPSFLGADCPVLTNQSGELTYHIEGRSIYFYVGEKQYVLKVRTTDDKEDLDFIDGAVIRYGHQHQVKAITREYGKACSVRLSDELRLKLQEEMRQASPKLFEVELTLEATLFTHSDYFSYLYQEPKEEDNKKSPSEQMEDFYSFLQGLKQNVKDYSELADEGLFFVDMASYSHDKKTGRSYDHAVFLDLMDVWNHNFGVIEGLKEGLKDANLGKTGIRDLGNLLKGKFVKERQNPLNKKLSDSLSESEKQRRKKMNYPRALIEHLCVPYLAILVYLESYEGVAINIQEEDFIDIILEYVISPFCEVHLGQNVALESHIEYIMRPPLKKDWTLLSRRGETLYEPIVRKGTRDFAIQHFYGAFIHIISIKALKDEGVSLDLNEKALREHCFVRGENKKRKNRRERLLNWIDSKNIDSLLNYQEDFKQEYTYLSEYYLSQKEKGKENLIFMINLQKKYPDLFLNGFLWLSKLLIDLPFWGDNELFQTAFLAYKKYIRNPINNEKNKDKLRDEVRRVFKKIVVSVFEYHREDMLSFLVSQKGEEVFTIFFEDERGHKEITENHYDKEMRRLLSYRQKAVSYQPFLNQVDLILKELQQQEGVSQKKIQRLSLICQEQLLVRFRPTCKLIKEAQKGNIKECQRYIEEGARIDSIGEDNKTALMCAAEQGHEEVVRFLVSQGASITLKNRNGKTALMYAIQKGHENMVHFFIKQLNATEDGDENKKMALIYAIESGQKKIIKLLLSSEDVMRNNANQIWEILCQSGEVKWISWLISQGHIDLNQYGLLGVLFAYGSNQIEVVDLILSYGFKLNQDQVVWAERLLLQACNLGDDKMIKKLNEIGVNVTAQKIEEEAIECACRSGSIELIIEFLRQGVTIQNGYSFVLEAITGGNLDVFQYFFNKGAKDEFAIQDEQTVPEFLMKNPSYKEGYSRRVDCLLQIALREKKWKIVEFLKSCQEGNFEEIPTQVLLGKHLLSACQEGSKDVVLALIQLGVDINFQNKNRLTPLMLAYQGGHTDIVSLLFQRGANPHLKCRWGRSVLFDACEYDDQEMIRSLRNCGIDLNEQDSNGQTALMYAVQKNRVKTVLLMLFMGVETNIQDHTGMTALMYACQKGDMKIIKALVAYGSDENAINKKGQTALWLAIHHNHKEVENFLLSLDDEINQQDICSEKGETSIREASSTEILGQQVFHFQYQIKRVEKQEKGIILSA